MNVLMKKCIVINCLEYLIQVTELNNNNNNNNKRNEF